MFFDAGQMTQVFNNLLINARQAMPSGGVVTITADNMDVSQAQGLPLKKGRYVRISVKDCGDGISPAIIGRIFDPYFSTKREGSGLGLATAYSMVRKHDGHLAVKSTPGSGSVFTVYLPAGDGRPVETVEPPLEPGSRQAGTSILVMDNEPTVRHVAQSILACRKHHPRFTSWGRLSNRSNRMSSGKNRST